LPVEDMSRPMKNGHIRNQDFYDRLFEFSRKNNFLYHPMVAASNVSKWCENLDWWEMMCKKYDRPYPSGVMMLEVRNNEWTQENLEDLKKYYKHEVDWVWNQCDQDPNKFVKQIFNVGPESVSSDELGYINISLPPANNQSACTISTCLFIRTGDLAIVPCHRTSYEQFIYGFLVPDEKKMLTFKANNTPFAVKAILSNHKMTMHGCDTCDYNGLCMRQCLGAQYEATNDPMFVDRNTCDLMFTKYDYLIQLYEEMGIMDCLRNVPTTEPYYAIAALIVEFTNKIKEGWKC